MADKIIHNVLGGPADRRVTHHGEVLVIGLGRFGSSLASTLIGMGYEVLGVDFEMDNVEEHRDLLPHAVQADAPHERALRQIGADKVVTAVVCIGTDVESSVLTAAALVDLGVPNIWAKAITDAHGRILQRVGCHHVVFPEAEMGARVAHLLTGSLLEYITLDDDFVIVETVVPGELQGKSLEQASLRARFRVTVVAVKPEQGPFTYAERDTVLAAGDLIVVAGHRSDIERFAELTARG